LLGLELYFKWKITSPSGHPTLYVSVYLDNNPSLQDHRLSLTIESLIERAGDNSEAAESPTPSTAAAAPLAAAPARH